MTINFRAAYICVSKSRHADKENLTSVESWNKTFHIEEWDDPMEPMDKMPLLRIKICI